MNSCLPPCFSLFPIFIPLYETFSTLLLSRPQKKSEKISQNLSYLFFQLISQACSSVWPIIATDRTMNAPTDRAVGDVKLRSSPLFDVLGQVSSYDRFQVSTPGLARPLPLQFSHGLETKSFLRFTFSCSALCCGWTLALGRAGVSARQPRSFSFGKMTQNHVHPDWPHLIGRTRAMEGRPNSQSSDKVRPWI